MRFESEGGRKVRESPPPLPIFPPHFSFENERKNVVLRFSPPFLLKTRERKFFNCFEKKKKTWSFLKELKYIFQLFFEKLILKKERERKKRERREEGKRKENETK